MNVSAFFIALFVRNFGREPCNKETTGTLSPRHHFISLASTERIPHDPESISRCQNLASIARSFLPPKNRDWSILHPLNGPNENWKSPISLPRYIGKNKFISVWEERVYCVIIGTQKFFQCSVEMTLNFRNLQGCGFCFCCQSRSKKLQIGSWEWMEANSKGDVATTSTTMTATTKKTDNPEKTKMNMEKQLIIWRCTSIKHGDFRQVSFQGCTAIQTTAAATLLGTMKFSNDGPCSKPTSIRWHQSWPKLRFFHYSGILWKRNSPQNLHTPEVYSNISPCKNDGFFRRFFSFLGPGVNVQGRTVKLRCGAYLLGVYRCLCT